MKKLLLICFLFAAFSSYAQIPTDCTTDVYLQRLPIQNHLRFAVDFNRLPYHKKLTIPACCGIFGPDDLSIRCNEQTGVHLDSASGDMFIPDYYEMTLTDQCGNEIKETYKEHFYLVSGNPIPWELYNINSSGYGTLRNVFQPPIYGNDPEEWDSIIHYGVPDTMLAYSKPIQHDDPWNDCMTGVTKGTSDCYYNKMDVDGVATGYYRLSVEINLPATVRDPGVYPNAFSTIIYLDTTAMTVTTNQQFPSMGSPVVSDLKVDGVKRGQSFVSSNGKAITWSAESSCHYTVVAQIYNKRLKGWQTVAGYPKIELSASHIINVPMSGTYVFYVTGSNPQGTSATISTGEIVVK